MPTVENLDRLQGLLARLVPLAEARRGELIRADDWNTLVAAVLDLARAVLEGGPSDVPVHAHQEQVALSWLDSQLRALLQEGPFSDPRHVSRVAAIERRLDSVAGDVGTVRDSVGSLRDRVGDVATRDVARESDLTSVRIQVEGINDSKRDVLALRTALDSIRTDVQKAVELGSGLVVNGRPVDVGDVVRRLGSVEELRERLTRSDGELLDAAAIEHRLAEVSASVVTSDQLDTALKKLRPRIGEEQVASIRQDVLAAASAQLESSLGSLRGELSGQIDTRLSDVDGRIATAVSAAAPGLRDEVLAHARDLVAERADGVVAQTRDLLEQRLAEATASFGARVDQGVASVRDQVLSETSARLDAVTRDLAPLREQVGQLSGATAWGPAFEDLRGHVAALNQRVAGVVDEALARSKEITADIVKREVGTLRDQLGSVVGDAVNVRLQQAVSGMTDTMRAIARDESQQVRVSLSEELRKTVPAHVEGAMSALPERVKADFEANGPLSQVHGQFVDRRLRPS